MSPNVAPLRRGLPLVGNLLSMKRDPLALVVDTMREQGPVARLRFGPRTVFLVTHPDLVQEVLQTQQKHFNKQTAGFKQVRLIVGQGLLTSEGSFWRRQRRIAQPAFHKTRLAEFAASMIAATAGLADRWQTTAARAGGTAEVDLDRDMMALTLEIVAETLLSAGVDGIDMLALARAIDFLLIDVRRRMTAPFHLPLSIPLPANVRFRRALAALDGVVGDIIARRRGGQVERNDLLQMLLDAVDEETGERMTDEQLRDEAVTMFLAGHETTGSALAWTFAHLARTPDVRRRLDDELAEVLDGREPALDDLGRLSYTEQVLSESMRLHPPAWMFARQTAQAVELGGYSIPEDSTVLISPYATHRHPEFWDDPFTFDPDRFAPERIKRHHKFQYLPFGMGQRKCIGAGFAMMEAKIILALLTQRFAVDSLSSSPPPPEPALTLRPRSLRMQVTARKNNS